MRFVFLDNKLLTKVLIFRGLIFGKSSLGNYTNEIWCYWIHAYDPWIQYSSHPDSFIPDLFALRKNKEKLKKIVRNVYRIKCQKAWKWLTTSARRSLSLHKIKSSQIISLKWYGSVKNVSNFELVFMFGAFIWYL